jgi:hypothetical protein
VLFDLTAPADGTLVVRLGWDSRQGRLELGLADRWLIPLPPDWSSIVGQLPVAAARTYRLRVADGAPWDYDDRVLPFVLATSIEQ